MKEDKNKRERPEVYPKPSGTDHQLKNQDEFIQVQNNREDDTQQEPTRNENIARERNFNDQEERTFNDQGRGI